MRTDQECLNGRERPAGREKQFLEIRIMRENNFLSTKMSISCITPSAQGSPDVILTLYNGGNSAAFGGEGEKMQLRDFSTVCLQLAAVSKHSLM